jgi:sugar phosphate isomerase/epimerase
VSNIAWEPAQDDAVRGLCARHAVQGIEVAPTRVWAEPMAVTAVQARDYAARWADAGIAISSLQALLFGRPHLTVFQARHTRGHTLAYLQGIIRLGGWLGAGALVFGAPANRRIGTLPPERALDLAEGFFRVLGETAAEHGTVFCIEPNPRAYGCDFVTDSRQGLELVRRVSHPGFGLHLDAAGMTLAGEEVETALQVAAPWLRHFHASEPELAPLGGGAVDHARLAGSLQRLAYGQWVALEMRAPGGAANLPALDAALGHLRMHYASG